LRDYASKNAPEGTVYFSGKVPYDRLHEWTCSADAGLSLFEPVSLSYEYSLPNKMFEFFMAGKPLLATDLPAIRQVYDKYPAGILVNKNLNPKDIAEAAAEIMNPEKYKERTAHALNAAKEYNYPAQTGIIQKILD
jgi:glycosyltransferase involved in cell wall biosynthesis